MGIILPLIYLVAGLTLALTLPEHRGRRLKEWASALLTRWIIPAVIIYTVATSRPELFFVAASTMVMMLLGVLGAGRITRDPVQKLAFVYLNAGLFGIPVVAGIWGDEAVRVYIGAYIGNSIMGATIRRVLRGLRTSPPVIAVVIGLLCLPAGPLLSVHGAGFYRALTWVFSFIGMIVLGMWLGAAKLHRADLTRAAGWGVLRTALVSVYSLGVLALARWAHDAAGVHFDQLLAYPQVLFILGVLPPAANIVILETHYRHEGTAAPVIAAGAVVSVGLIALAVPILQLAFSG